MQRTLYIHLGQQKTGTSSFQRFCTAYRRELIERFGILYPTPPKEPAHRHASLFPFRADRWQQVREEADRTGCKTVIISCEDLSVSGVQDEDLKAIQALFHEFRLVYILYMRRIDEACKEWYMQSAKRDNMVNHTYSSYMSAMHKKKSFRLYPSRLLQRCEKQVGKDGFVVKIYEQERLANKNIVDDIFSILGVALPDNMDRSRRYNQGIPELALPCLTHTLRQYEINDPTRVEIYAKIISAYKRKDPPPLRKDILPEVEKEIGILEERYLPGYAKLFDKQRLDLSFPKDATTPYDVLVLDMLYSILFELRKQQTRRFLLSKFYDEKILPTIMSIPLALSGKLRAALNFFKRS